MPKREEKNFYAIAQGSMAPVITQCWLTAHDLVSGYSGNCFKGFKTFDMAKDYLKRKGCFTFYFLEEPADGPKPKSNNGSSYYTVANGRHVGIYSDYKTGAEPQVKKYSGACHKSYATFESANAAMQAREQIEYRIPVTDIEATAHIGSDTTDEDDIVAGVNNMTLETQQSSG